MPEYLTLRDGRKIILDAPEEDSRINAGIAADPDTAEWTDEDFARALPAREALPKIFPPEIAAAMLKPRGQPKPETPKVHLNLSLDADVVDGFKATGRGWQSRMNQVLRDWIRAHPPA